MTEKIAYWIEIYSDEIVPCDCSLQGWADWLAKPDESWNRPAAAKDGDVFNATRGVITYHTATPSPDGHGLCFAPMLPETYDMLAIAYYDGGGWDADDLHNSVESLAETLKDEESAIVAVIRDNGSPWIVTFHDNPPRCAARLAQ